MLTPRPDLVTTATLVAENAILTAEIKELRGLATAFTWAMRELPPGDYPKTVQALWNIVRDHDEAVRRHPGL